MREYHHHATIETIEALRRLRRAWAGYHVSREELVVSLADGSTVTLRVEGTEPEPDLVAYRLSATLTPPGPEPLVPAGAFGADGNDVVVFRSETWIEAPPGADGSDTDQVVQFTGSPLQRSPTAVAVCAVDDALVVATASGTGLLVRCGLKPDTLEVTRDREVIARFLGERHYGRAGAEG